MNSEPKNQNFQKIQFVHGELKVRFNEIEK